MQERLNSLHDEIRKALEKAADIDALQAVRIKYLGRKGEINRLFKLVSQSTPE